MTEDTSYLSDPDAVLALEIDQRVTATFEADLGVIPGHALPGSSRMVILRAVRSTACLQLALVDLRSPRKMISLAIGPSLSSRLARCRSVLCGLSVASAASPCVHFDGAGQTLPDTRARRKETVSSGSPFRAVSLVRSTVSSSLEGRAATLRGRCADLVRFGALDVDRDGVLRHPRRTFVVTVRFGVASLLEDRRNGLRPLLGQPLLLRLFGDACLFLLDPLEQDSVLLVARGQLRGGGHKFARLLELAARELFFRIVGEFRGLHRAHPRLSPLLDLCARETGNRSGEHVARIDRECAVGELQGLLGIAAGQC
jgi:hypothetical protein